MKKIDLLYGALIGFISSFVGIYLFMILFTEYGLMEGISILKSRGQLGKLIALGSILNLVVFFVLLQINKELMARGVVLATLILTIITLFA
ncbi:hypothetical protein [Flavobacterium sp.]|uniref:hypothetical protein n=1 Tax=Flavobacterium sp. TaxID=239 RepID=UPI002608A652|nr:hypothetical protein [Flavobacterium sp.]MDD3005512.1 hypothetical protein [Flavobacterium sp.]